MARKSKTRSTAQGASRRATPATVREIASVKVSSVALDPPLPYGEADPAEDLLGISSVLRGEAHPTTKVSRSFMGESYGGGQLESVPDFDVSRAITSGLVHSGDVFWPQLQNPAQRRKESEEKDGLRPETVFYDPDDTRRPVPNSAVVPWRCIALLNIRFPDGFTARGTGWFIAPRTLVTAAHCVHDRIHGRAMSMVATPGFHMGAAPYDRFAVTNAEFNPEWTRTFVRELDFALIYIGQPAGVGYFGYSTAADKSLARVLVNISGYPDDRPSTQWFDGGRVLAADRNFIYHTIDTESGQSGAPLFWSDGRQRVCLGIHTYGASSRDRTNIARRITEPLFDLFESKKI